MRGCLRRRPQDRHARRVAPGARSRDRTSPGSTRPAAAETASRWPTAPAAPVIATYPATSGRRSWAVFDIDEQGNLVAVQGDRLVAFSLAAPRPRVLAKRLWGSSVSTRCRARRLHHRRPQQRARPARARRPHGKVLKRLDRYGKRRWPEGEIALTDRWAAWSVKRAHVRRAHRPGQRVLEEALARVCGEHVSTGGSRLGCVCVRGRSGGCRDGRCLRRSGPLRGGAGRAGCGRPAAGEQSSAVSSWRSRAAVGNRRPC